MSLNLGNGYQTKEHDLGDELLQKLQDLKYTYHPDIRDKDTLKQNFREKFQVLNHVRLQEGSCKNSPLKRGCTPKGGGG